MQASDQRSIYQQGLCVDAGLSDIFFSEDVAELAEAQAVCRRCPVQVACLRSALEGGAEWGVWGGVIFWDGEPFYRRRGRGRPRKEDAARPLEASRADLWELVRSA